MATLENRMRVVEALDAANVAGLQTSGLVSQFITGASDISFTDLQLDSLARMEFCIALEVNCGISILPDSLYEIGTLGRIADMIAEGC
jgi:acyl carrier protein